jgi:hypothetical protein
MRQRAKRAGNLQTTDQEKVSTHGQDIVIQPASTEVVYVPEYNPWLVYGDPLAIFPGWYPYPGLFLEGPGIAFGLGFGVGFFGGFGWGWGHWGFDWHGGGRAVYNHNTYISHSRTIADRNSFNSTRANFDRSPGLARFERLARNVWRTVQRVQRIQSWRCCVKQFLPWAIQLWRFPRRRFRWRLSRRRRPAIDLRRR